MAVLATAARTENCGAGNARRNENDRNTSGRRVENTASRRVRANFLPPSISAVRRLSEMCTGRVAVHTGSLSYAISRTNTETTFLGNRFARSVKRPRSRPLRITNRPSNIQRQKHPVQPSNISEPTVFGRNRSVRRVSIRKLETISQI